LVSCGSKNSEYKSLLAVYDNVTTFGFLSLRGMSYLYYLSDIAITRGGATSLAEQQLFGIKKIIVPTPYT
jgi:UDP-N-acetylglucosamine:LPS N-acetylglucosamine transferase